MAIEMTLSEAVEAEKRRIDRVIAEFHSMKNKRLVIIIILIGIGSVVGIMQFIGIDIEAAISLITKVTGMFGVPVIAVLGVKENYAKLKEENTGSNNRIARFVKCKEKLDNDLQIVRIMQSSGLPDFNAEKSKLNKKLIDLCRISLSTGDPTSIDNYERTCLS
jgi:hypothetical protein